MFGLRDIFLGVAALIVSTQTAYAEFSKTPEALIAAYKSFYAAKNCAGLISLRDYTNVTLFVQQQDKEWSCNFETPLQDITFSYAPLAAGVPQPTKEGPDNEVIAFNLPIAGELRLSVAKSAISLHYQIGQKDGNYFIASPMTAEVEKKQGII